MPFNFQNELSACLPVPLPPSRSLFLCLFSPVIMLVRFLFLDFFGFVLVNLAFGLLYCSWIVSKSSSTVPLLSGEGSWDSVSHVDSRQRVKTDAFFSGASWLVWQDTLTCLKVTNQSRGLFKVSVARGKTPLGMCWPTRSLLHQGPTWQSIRVWGPRPGMCALPSIDKTFSSVRPGRAIRQLLVQIACLFLHLLLIRHLCGGRSLNRVFTVWSNYSIALLQQCGLSKSPSLSPFAI